MHLGKRKANTLRTDTNQTPIYVKLKTQFTYCVKKIIHKDTLCAFMFRVSQGDHENFNCCRNEKFPVMGALFSL